MHERADVIVVGAGVQGASLAFHLAERGADVVVLERSSVAAGATGRSSGFVRMHYDLESESRFAWLSLPYFRDWTERVGEGDCGFVRTGFVQVVPPNLVDALRANVAMHQGIGIEASIVGPDEVARLVPGSATDDIVAAADALREVYRAPALLVGHSLGGSAVLGAAEKIPEAVGVATIGAPFDPEHVAQLFGASLGEIESSGEAVVDLGGRPFKIRKSFLEDLRSQCNAQRIGDLKKALVLFHSPQDNTVGIDNARLIYKAARHPKSFVSLDGADHLLSRRSDGRYVADVLAAWASRYLPEQPEPEMPEDAPEGVVVVDGRTTSFLQRIRARNHVFSSDEPLDKGGTNLGPNPYDLLLASLGACTSMTLKLYAGRKEWPLDAVRVTLRHDRVHAKDCQDCESKSGMIDFIDKKLELEGDLTDEQRERLLEISARCPVHRTLINEIKIRSELL